MQHLGALLRFLTGHDDASHGEVIHRTLQLDPQNRQGTVLHDPIRDVIPDSDPNLRNTLYSWPRHPP